MKKNRLFLLILFVLPGLKARSQNYFLLPANFYLQKDAKLNLRLLETNDFTKQNDVPFQSAKITKFDLYQGNKKTDISKLATDSTLNYKTDEHGLALIDMVEAPASSEMSRNRFLRTFGDDDDDKITDKIKNSNQLYFKEEHTSYMKTLVEIDKSSDKVYSKDLHEDFEIILLDNPYKMDYGDDVRALLKFKGKPLVAATVYLYVKTPDGSLFPQRLSTDGGGLVYFKMSREGIYILQAKHFEQSKDKNADFVSWRASFTFAFSSNDDLPNTYKNFGFGETH